MKRSLLIALPLALAAANLQGAQFYAAGEPRTESPQVVLLQKDGLQPISNRFRVASYNVEDFYDGVDDGTNCTPERAERHAKNVAALLDQIHPDVLILEEVESDRALQMINHDLKSPFPFAAVTQFATDRGKKDKLNIGLLSRFEVHGLRALDFESMSGPARPPRGVLNFYLEPEKDVRLLLYGVHLKSNWGDADKNRVQRLTAVKLLKADADAIVAKSPQYKWEVLMAGDTNVDPDDPQFAHDPTFSPIADWVDLWRGRPPAERVTIPTRHGDPMQEFPPATFDRFFVSRELCQKPWAVGTPQVLQTGVDTNNVFTLPGQNDFDASDHYPIYVDIVR